MIKIAVVWGIYSGFGAKNSGNLGILSGFGVENGKNLGVSSAFNAQNSGGTRI